MAERLSPSGTDAALITLLWLAVYATVEAVIVFGPPGLASLSPTIYMGFAGGVSFVLSLVYLQASGE